MDELFTVFEATNDSLKEVFVGFTARPLDKLTARLRAFPPACMRGWRADGFSVRPVEFELPLPDAVVFLETYARTPLPPDWRYVRQDNPDPL